MGQRTDSGFVLIPSGEKHVVLYVFKTWKFSLAENK